MVRRIDSPNSMSKSKKVPPPGTTVPMFVSPDRTEFDDLAGIRKELDAQWQKVAAQFQASCEGAKH